MPDPLIAALSPHEYLNSVLQDAGVSKTVYAYVMPETEQTLRNLLDTDRGAIEAMYREAWTQKQDVLHEEFFAAWRDWTAPIVNIASGDFPWVYTTGGASEALREAIYAYGHAARRGGFAPVIHVFSGDYEGFAAYAQAAGIAVTAHNRAAWRQTLALIGPTDQVYFSQPSALDGNVWAEADEFIAALYNAQPTAQIILDLTYVGCVAREFKVETASPNIRALIFSLSKPMGVYYHRIGGMLAREEYPGLFGNKWFKNLLSIRFGTEMMRRFGVFDLPRRYRAAAQLPAAALAKQRLKLDVTPSDVFLLATGAPSPQRRDIERYLTRGGAGDEKLRLCLTPMMAALINPALDARVTARAHERIES